jgi:16S rRNA processing protein RimM
VAERTAVVGHVTRAHGIRGEVAVEVRSDNPDRFSEGQVVFTGGGRSLTIAGVHSHGSRLLVKFEGVDDRATAESMRGQELVVPESWLPALPDGQFWPFQLEGSTVLTESGQTVGTLVEVIPNPANDLWVAVDDRGAETLVPAVHDVIVDVDIEAKRIVVRDVPGLTVPEEDR